MIIVTFTLESNLSDQFRIQCQLLYTNIPHNNLLKGLYGEIEFCLKGRENADYDKYGAKWQQRSGSLPHFLHDFLKKSAVKHVLENFYFKLQKKSCRSSFRQVVGIPVGSEPVPILLFANLFLCHYESRWIKKSTRTDLRHAIQFVNVFHFIDNMGAL